MAGRSATEPEELRDPVACRAGQMRAPVLDLPFTWGAMVGKLPVYLFVERDFFHQ